MIGVATQTIHISVLHSVSVLYIKIGAVIWLSKPCFFIAKQIVMMNLDQKINYNKNIIAGIMISFPTDLSNSPKLFFALSRFRTLPHLTRYKSDQVRQKTDKKNVLSALPFRYQKQSETFPKLSGRLPRHLKSFFRA